jgi:hypothetical protein
MNDTQETMGARVDVKARADVITYPQALLIMARKLIDEGQFGLAVIICHLACEVATERALSQAFARRGIADVEDAVEAFLNGYSLRNDRNRQLYTALTGDDIAQQPFWPKFTASARRRNDIVHGELPVGHVQQVDAEESFTAASDLVAHLKQ